MMIWRPKSQQQSTILPRSHSPSFILLMFIIRRKECAVCTAEKTHVDTLFRPPETHNLIMTTFKAICFASLQVSVHQHQDCTYNELSSKMQSSLEAELWRPSLIYLSLLKTITLAHSDVQPFTFYRMFVFKQTFEPSFTDNCIFTTEETNSETFHKFPDCENLKPKLETATPPASFVALSMVTVTIMIL